MPVLEPSEEGLDALVTAQGTSAALSRGKIVCAHAFVVCEFRQSLRAELEPCAEEVKSLLLAWSHSSGEVPGLGKEAARVPCALPGHIEGHQDPCTLWAAGTAAVHLRSFLWPLLSSLLRWLVTGFC